LFQALRISCKSGEEAVRAGEFLSGLILLAKSAGGEAPLPASPTITEIEDTQRLVGSEQLVAIKTKVPEWEDKIKAWTTLRDLIGQRVPTWSLVERLAKHAAPMAEAKPHLDQIEAIRNQRLLLENSDPANAIRVALAGLLRDAVQKGYLGTRQHSTLRRPRLPRTASGLRWRLPTRKPSRAPSA
jgi:hypothetical protein